MMNNGQFDNQVKKQLGDYQPDVPPHIWENILAKKDSKKPVGFWFSPGGKKLFFILILLGAGAVATLLVNNYNSPATQIPEKENVLSPNPGTTLNGNNLNSKATQHNNSSESSAVSNTDNIAIISVKKEYNTNLGPSNKEEKVNAGIEKNNTDNLTRFGKEPVVANKSLRHGVSSQKMKIPNTHDLESVSDNPLKIQDIAIAEKNADIYSHNHKRKSGIASSVKIIKADAGIETDYSGETLSPELLSSHIPQKYLLTLTPINTEKIFDFTVTNKPIQLSVIPCPTVGNSGRKSKRYIEIYAGPDYVFRSYNDKENAAYLQKRKESTSFTSAYSLGFRYTKVFKNSLSFRTGLNYSRVNEKFRFEQGHIVQQVYTINSSGDTTGSYSTTGTRYKVTNNRYSTVDIPLLIGYELENGRFGANINMGLMVNAYSWQRGDVLDSSYQPVNITTGKMASAYQFKTNAGLGFMGAASVYYKLSEKTSLMAEPYFRYNFSPANKNAISLKQKYTTVGLKLGVRINF